MLFHHLFWCFFTISSDAFSPSLWVIFHHLFWCIFIVSFNVFPPSFFAISVGIFVFSSFSLAFFVGSPAFYGCRACRRIFGFFLRLLQLFRAVFAVFSGECVRSFFRADGFRRYVFLSIVSVYVKSPLLFPFGKTFRSPRQARKEAAKDPIPLRRPPHILLLKLRPPR